MTTMRVPFKVKARYGWSGQAKEDLGFLEGDVMEVSRVAGEWYYGRLLRNKKCAGYFPNNFVTIVEERINSVQSVDSGRSKQAQQGQPILQQSKSGLPPIPTRSTNHDSSKYRSSRQAYHSTPNLPATASGYENNAPVGSNNGYSRRAEIYGMRQPGYDQLAMKKRNNINDSLTKKPNVNKYEDFVDTPALPPLPQLQSSKRNGKHRQPVKSYSSNDLPTSRSRDPADHFVDDQRFFDGFNSGKRSSVDTSSVSSGGLFSHSQYMDNSVTSSENSFAIMSDFSATSAGSFARHRKAQSFTDSLERSENGHLQYGNSIDTKQVNDTKTGGFWKRFMNKNDSNNNGVANSLRTNESFPKLPDLQTLDISPHHNDAHDWLTVKAHVNRSKSLTKYEKHPRYMRALERNRDLVLHPQDAIYNGLNTNEIRGHGKPGSVDIELAGLNTQYIDSMTWKRCSKNSTMRLENWVRTTFSARYSTDIEKLRGIYIFCTEMFSLIDDHGHSDFSREPANLESVLYQKYCTPYELTCLFKRLAVSLSIQCEVVIGFLKTPFAVNHEFEYNHCWLRVLVNNEWRFIDVILGNITNPIHEFVNNKPAKRADDSYFLVEPLEFIYTHIPPREYEQHIVPSLDQLSILYLPLVFPSFFKNGLVLYKFSTALSYLEDNEIYECSIEIPNDIEIFSSVVVNTEDKNKAKLYQKMELSLAQVRKHRTESGKRVIVIKAVLPPGVKSGALYIHSGVRGTQTTIANVHPLSMIIPLYHEGSESKYEFVSKVPNENILKLETYVMEPQNKYLFPDNEYNFEVLQHPFDGIMYNSTAANQSIKQPIAIKSPSGKIYNLEKNDPHVSYGTWKKTIKVKESGVWTGMILSDCGLGWANFAEWYCI